MDANSKINFTKHERASLLLFMVCIVFVGLSVVSNFALEASGPMMAISIGSCVFAFLPFFSIIHIQRHLSSSNTNGYNNYSSPRIRTGGVLFGIVLIFFIIGGVLASDEIYGPDIPGGIFILIAGFLALAASALYPVYVARTFHPVDLSPPPPYLPEAPKTQGALSQAKEKEIIHEKEVIVKIRCRYCGNTFNETLDQCPVCGAKK